MRERETKYSDNLAILFRARLPEKTKEKKISENYIFIN